MQQLNGKVALVTGGNSGIGYATAKALKEQGAEVIITGRRAAAVEAAANELGVTGIVSDQGNVDSTELLAAEVKVKFGRIDILFINAGVLESGTIEQTTEAMFDAVIDVNFKGAFFTLSKMTPLLVDGASVIFLSSNTAHMNGPGSAIYSASKAALNKVMQIAAAELAPRNIRVNAISPGPTKTEILKKNGLSEAELDGLHGWIIDRVPLRRMGEAENVAKMVVHLSSDAASFMTGSEVLMDGGMSL